MPRTIFVKHTLKRAWLTERDALRSIVLSAINSESIPSQPRALDLLHSASDTVPGARRSSPCCNCIRTWVHMQGELWCSACLLGASE